MLQEHVALREDATPDIIAAALAEIAAEAGVIAMRWFKSGQNTSARIDFKTGGSPVTEADLAVDAFLNERLRQLMPEAGWLSEETIDTDDRLARRSLFIVDPIDGTRAYTAGDARWAVSIALAREGRPIAGVVHAPALQETYVAAMGRGATCNGVLLATPQTPLAGATIAGPQPFADKIADMLAMRAIPKTPSLAVRFAHVASGAFGAALASLNSHDWDIAAADLILHEAGALLCGSDGLSLRYNKRSLKHGVLMAAATKNIGQLAAAVRA